MEQRNLFGKPKKDWEDEWSGMPGFVQEKQEPYSVLIVRFDTESDLEDFSKKIGQRINQKTKSIWHPEKSHWGGENTKKKWIDES